MTKLFDTPTTGGKHIRPSLNDLSDWLYNPNPRYFLIQITAHAKGRLIVSGEESTIITGSLGVGVNTVPNDVAIETSLPVRFQGRKFEVNNDVPRTGLYNKGDMIWNDNPVPNGTLGWICIRTGTPGEWRTFGMIGG